MYRHTLCQEILENLLDLNQLKILKVLCGSKKKSPRKKNPQDPKPNPVPNLTLPLTLRRGIFS